MNARHVLGLIGGVAPLTLLVWNCILLEVWRPWEDNYKVHVRFPHPGPCQSTGLFVVALSR